jgi:GNAT superfamily N-acetyltransferase
MNGAIFRCIAPGTSRFQRRSDLITARGVGMLDAARQASCHSGSIEPGRKMRGPLAMDLVLETEPKFEDIRLLDERLYEFNVQATGIADGKLLAFFLRDGGGAAVGGVFGWTWGETCYVRYLFIPADMRNQGYGTGLMEAVAAEASARGCGQIVLTTHDFQAPEFYRKLGFEITGRVHEYPRGSQYLTMVKRLTA